MTDTPTTAETPADATAAPEEATDYVSEVTFAELGLSEPVLRALSEKGYTRPTPVQARAFAPAKAGRDLIVRSKTGTGKTAAFGLPLLEAIDPASEGVQALILCPTRELALQVAAELKELARYKGTKVAAIYGGTSLKEQEDALASGLHIVVGTPGRVMDHIQRGNLKLGACTHAVLDEADEMLNQGFYEDVTRILDKLPKGRQVLLFSATVPADIERLIARYTTDAETLLLSGDVFTVDHIKHIRYDVSDEYPKPRNLIYALEMEHPENAIIFCNTRDDTALVTAVLNRNGFDAELLNGDLPQKERERVMGKVRRGEVAFMVATDIAARGIDISHLGWVINYSLPEDPAVYLHRVGRTGRIGRKGVAINLISGRELGTFSSLEKKYNINFEKKEMPKPEQATKMWTDRHVREIRVEASSTVYEGYLQLASQLKGRTDADDLIAFLLKYFFTRLRMERAQAALEEAAGGGEAPVPQEPRGEAEGRRRRERPERGARREERPERGPRRDERPEAGARREERAPRREERAPRREERGERRERTVGVEAAEGESKLWVNLGSMADLDEAGLTAALESLGAPAGKVLRQDLKPTFSYVIVPEADAEAFEALSGKSHGAQVLKVERSRPRGERPERRPRPERSPEAGEGEVKLQVNVGSADSLDDEGFKQVLAGAGAPTEKVLRTLVRERYAYAYVTEADAQVFEDIAGRMWQGRTLTVERRLPLPERGEPRRERPPRPERAERSERTERPERTPSVEAQPGQVRVWVNLGRADKLDAEGLKSALETLGAPAGSVEQADLRQTFAYVFVQEENVEKLEALTGQELGEKTVKLERARPRT